MEKIYSMFLRLMTDYKHLLYSEEEMQEEFAEILDNALIEVQLKGIMLDVSFIEGEASRDLLANEQYILAHACVFLWVQPMVNSAELLAAQLSPSELSQFSNANRITSAIRLYNNTASKLNSLISDYDNLNEIQSIKKKLGDE